MSPTGEEALGGALAVLVAFEDALMDGELEKVDAEAEPNGGDKEPERDGETGTDAEADGRDVVVSPMLVVALVDTALDTWLAAELGAGTARRAFLTCAVCNPLYENVV
jgi:hypothetical protein